MVKPLSPAYFAKCLNCETGITPTPCGTCHTCQAIDAGQFLDLFEVDAASRTKVEDTRELLDNVHYPPTQGRYKIYLIDEVHMLSNHSFNALLKTLEEPPAACEISIGNHRSETSTHHYLVTLSAISFKTHYARTNRANIYNIFALLKILPMKQPRWTD